MLNGRWILGMALVLAATPAWAADFRAERHAQMDAKRAELFAQADGDGDGALTREELTRFEELMRSSMEDERFARADTDQNGKVTLEELSAAGPPHPFRGGCFER